MLDLTKFKEVKLDNEQLQKLKERVNERRSAEKKNEKDCKSKNPQDRAREFYSDVKIDKIPCEWDFDSLVIPQMVLSFARAIMFKEIESVERFFKGIEALSNIVNEESRSNICGFRIKDHKKLFEQAQYTIEESQKLRVLDFKEDNGECYLHLKMHTDLKLSEIFEESKGNTSIKEAFSQYCKDIQSIQKNLEEKRDEMGEWAVDSIFAPMLLELFFHPFLFERLDEKNKNLLHKTREAYKENQTSQFLINLVNIAQFFAKNDGTFDYYEEYFEDYEEDY